MAITHTDGSGPPAGSMDALPADLGGLGGAATTYLMRGYGAVSAAQVYWTSSTPDDTDAPETVSNVSILKE